MALTLGTWLLPFFVSRLYEDSRYPCIFVVQIEVDCHSSSSDFESWFLSIGPPMDRGLINPLKGSKLHNIIQIHNNVLWDWLYFMEYSPHSIWMWRIFYGILLVPQNTVMDLNNVMYIFYNYFEIFHQTLKNLGWKFAWVGNIVVRWFRNVWIEISVTRKLNLLNNLKHVMIEYDLDVYYLMYYWHHIDVIFFNLQFYMFILKICINYILLALSI